MVNNISWSSYWYVLFILIIIYYAYVLLAYYRGDLFKRLTVKKVADPAGSFPGLNQREESITDELFPGVQSLTSEMSAYLEQAAYAKAGKTEIVFGLQQIIKKYPGIKDSKYQPAINSLIEFESGDKCAVHLSEEEIRQVWLV